MKLRLIILVLVIISVNSCNTVHEELNPVDWVDVFIGTSNSRWMLGPYATVPFGMVQLGPDNQGETWMGGYDYAINNISGFSHIHAWTMAGLRMMPTTTDLAFMDTPVDFPYKGAVAGYHSRILKETEKASPGFYSVYLYDHDVLAEMTVTTRCGFQRYTFPEKKESRILIDLLIPSEYKYSIEDAEIKKVSNTEIEGFAKCRIGRTQYYNYPWHEYTLNFVLKFDKPFDTFNGWNEGNLKKNTTEISGKNDIGAYVTYKTSTDEVIMVKSGISLVSIDQARLNLKTEMDGYEWDFDAVKNTVHETWNKLLSKVEVKGGTDEDKRKFYTNLYRSYAAKQTWNDVNGKYMDPCENVQQMPEGQSMIGGDSFWNSFWNLNSLWSLVSPDIMEKYIVPKDSVGRWLEDYNPFSGNHFVEGNGWQYSLYVPHDIPGLINLIGVDLFNTRLEEGFEKSVSEKFAAHAFDHYQPEPVEYYINMGNQVNMQAPYLFNYSGKPWLTQKYSRAILDTYYGSTPYHGWEGD